jgi:hypothetical protein
MERRTEFIDTQGIIKLHLEETILKLKTEDIVQRQREREHVNE